MRAARGASARQGGQIDGTHPQDVLASRLRGDRSRGRDVARRCRDGRSRSGTHLRSVLELTTNAARQLTRLVGEWPPGPCRPETTADLQAIAAASQELSATAGRLLESCQPPR
jgi:hypothetical protein